MREERQDFRVLLVDDEPRLRETLATYLINAWYDVECAPDAIQAMERLSAESFDLVMTDISMPEVTGLELLEFVKNLDERIDVIMITGYLDISYAIGAMRHGAYDFFTKPFNFDKILLTVSRVHEKQRLRADAERYLVLKREQELQAETTLSLAYAAEARDRQNVGHGKRVARYAVQLAERLRYTEEKTQRLRFAALLHDIGKIGIDDEILNKPGKLNDSEMQQMRRHVEIGEYILKPVSLYREVAPIVREHHERYDGLGYPDGIAGEDISMDGRILCLADYYDAITSERPYRRPASVEEATDLLLEQSGKFFDPVLTDIFVEMQLEQAAKAEKAASLVV